MSESLRPDGGPVRIAGVMLRTPGLAGTVSAVADSSTRTRGFKLTTNELDTALQREGMRTRRTISIAGAREVASPARGLRSTSFGEPAMQVQVPAPAEHEAQVMLTTDESGVMTWHFPTNSEGHVDTTRGQGMQTYLVPRSVPPPADVGDRQMRGLVTSIGLKVLSVIVFPILDPLLGSLAEDFAARWEAGARPYRLRSFTPDDYASAPGNSNGSPDWAHLSGGRALLMVHGTGSLTHTGFAGLGPAFVRRLNKRYEGRVFALDHPTISKTPTDNARWFADRLPPGVHLELDIVCHSRGGLVARSMSEHSIDLGLQPGTLDIKRVVFVGVPNAGTKLTDPDRMNDYVNAYTNLLNFFPENGVTDLMQAVITIVKLIAVGAAKGLVGLESMVPDGPYLTDLNKGAQTRSDYYALASNYEPVHPGLKLWTQNRLMDSIFNTDNDLIVPTQGVYDSNGSASFPVQEYHAYPGDAGIPHSGYFSDPDVRKRIWNWLK